jgi:Iron-sulfur cluster-binding domain
LHRLAPDFIAEAVSRGFKVHLYTTLVGLTPVGAEKLSLNRPEYVRLHAPDMTEFKYDPHKWLAQLEMFKAKAKLPYSVMAMSEVSPVISNAMTIDYPPMLSRGGNLWEREKIKGHLHCAMDRWHSNVVLPNGDVFLCCMDFGLTAPVGNLLNQSYAEILEAGERYRDVPPEICRSCEWAVKA